MKKIILLLMAVTFMTLCACNNTNTVDLTDEPSQTTSIIASDQEETTEQIPKIEEEQNKIDEIIDSNVEIILTMFSNDNSVTIEQYVEEQNAYNPDRNYYVYDDTHYAFVMKDSERKDYLENLIDAGTLDEAFKECFQSEACNGAFLTMDYNDDFSEFIFYVDKEKYDGIGVFAPIMPVMTSAFVSDAIQAYKLVPLDERSCTVIVIDNDTQEILYDSSKIE